MGEPSLRELEQDVEVARSKLARDLSTLRAPETYSQFTSAVKEVAWSAKDALIDKAKARVQLTVESFVEDLKAKAAANPTAALAIGAGIAWRLIQRPPIATALIGAGLISLMRTNATPVNGRSNSDYVSEAAERLREQASDFATDVKEQAGRAVQVATDRMSELAGGAKERAEDAVRVATDQVVAGASATKERIQEWGGQATSAIRETTEQAREQAASVAERAADQLRGLRDSVVQTTDKMGVGVRMDSLSNAVENAVSERETRDSLLLGAASVAVIAALGIACQKKLTETTPTD
jgi:hypothetical protein